MSEIVHRIEARIREVKYAIGFRPGRLLFEHIPKSAGTSVVRYLTGQYPNSRTFSIDGMNPSVSHQNFRDLSEDQRFNYRLIYGHGAHKLRKLVHPDTIATTLLRDPVDRLISHYYFAKSSPNHYLYDDIKERELSLADYVQSDLSAELRNNLIYRFSKISWQDAESDPVRALDETRRILQENYAIVGTVDDLSGWAEKIKPLVGLKGDVSQFRENITRKRKSRSDIDADTIALIQRLNRLDIELYEGVRMANKASD